MTRPIDFAEEFVREFDEYPGRVKAEVIGLLELLTVGGPDLGRPHVHTMKGSIHSNMNELRCGGDRKTWRVAFEYTPEQRALLLAAGNKSGAKERRFYQVLIRKAYARFDEYLAATTGKESTKGMSI